jgi:hypothetical protein
MIVAGAASRRCGRQLTARRNATVFSPRLHACGLSLCRIADMLEDAQADQRAARYRNAWSMSPPLVPHPETAVTDQPGQRPLDYPPVPTELLAGLDPAPGDPGRDAPPAQCPPAARRVVGLVAVQLGGAFAGPAGAALRALDRRGCWPPTTPPPAGRHGGRRPGGTLSLACRGRSGWGRSARLPRLARTLEESRQTRDQSIPSTRPSSLSSAACSCCHTPAACQSRRRRQQVARTARAQLAGG